MSQCPLCSSYGEPFYKDEFFICPKCKGIFKNPKLLLDEEKEKERYELHSDDASDHGYQQFVSPIVKSVIRDFKTTDSGLDFGTGQSQIVAKLLQNEYYDVKVYDPFFARLKKIYKKSMIILLLVRLLNILIIPKRIYTFIFS